jgi:hypothetical protein
MDESDKAALFTMGKWFFGIVFGLMILGGAASVISRAYDLAWFPWEIQMKTGMIRASNSYLTSQQSALRQFYLAYGDTDNPGQKAAIIRQMHEIADTISDDVQPDIRSFLATR